MNMKKFPLYGIGGRKGWAYWLLLFYGLLFVASLIASYIRNEEPVIPAFALHSCTYPMGLYAGGSSH